MRPAVLVSPPPFLFFSFLFLAFCANAQPPVYGCKDPAALNYSSLATVDNGSCKYQRNVYTPTPKTDTISGALKETSGLQWAGNSLWSFNDGGGTATLFRLDTASDAILQTVNLEGVTNVDWEDIAFDGTHFYIGDFGNNANGAREDLKIYRLPLSAIPDYPGNETYNLPASAIKVISFRYSDQPQPPATATLNNTKWDCEAMLVDGGKIHLFSKNWVDTTTTHYVIPDTVAGNYTATALETLAPGYLVTAADKAPGSNVLLLLGYQQYGFGNHYLTILSGYSGGAYFNGSTRLIDLPTAAEMGQAEGLTFLNNRYGFISNEWFQRSVVFPPTTITVTQRLRTFSLTDFAGDITLPLSLLKFGVKPVGGVQQIDWLFSEPAVEVSIQHSRNGTDFTNLQTHYNGRSGSLRHQPITGPNFYRLFFKEKGGAWKFSTIHRIVAEAKNSLGNLVLSASGQLQVVNHSNQPAAYRAKLFAADGRTLAQAGRFTFLPGLNRVQFNKPLHQNTLLFLQLKNEKEEITRMLWVQ